MFKWTPARLRFALNIYGPYLGAGVKVRRISADWRTVEVRMRLCWYNRNAVGTHFGGSLYAMTDPHLMLMLMQLLGKGYTVWDKAATIEFITPGRGEVYAVITISEQQLAEIKRDAAGGTACYPKFTVAVTAKDGTLVARVRKTLYVRKR